MRRRPLGRTGFSASVLGVGDVADRSIPLHDCAATVQRALDRGLNVVDTAPMYENGYSEEILRSALEGHRHRVFLIDKIDELEAPVEPQVDESLRRLGVGYVDLFAFHAVPHLESWERVARVAMEELSVCQRVGKLRFKGISSHHPDVLRVALESGLCDVVMFPVGPFVNRRFLDETLPLARRKGVGTVCFKTFGAGKLLGDTSGYNAPLQPRPRGKFSSGGASADAETERPRLSVKECLHYTLTVDPDVALLGLSYPNEQDAAFAAYGSFRPLDAEAMREIERRAADAVEGKGPCWWNPEQIS